MNCYTVAAGQAFAQTLAGWILGRYGGQTESLVKTLVLLPNRRACLALRQAFLECTGGQPMLLPRLQPIGDLDGDEILWDSTAPHLPPAISPLRRQLLLTQLVMRFENAQLGRQHNPEQAVQLAEQLARFIDDAAREELDFSRLSTLVPEEFALHWQQTLDFLKLVSHHWPLILQKENAVDPATRRHLQLMGIAGAWAKQPPTYPVIAAGSTGSQPATASLLATIAKLPQGSVILPGLDTGMKNDEWDILGETHPQYALKQLLEKMGCGREKIVILSAAEGSKIPRQARDDKITFLQTIFQPPATTAHWPALPKPVIEGLQLLIADTLADEARMIALCLRETLETPGKTAALVTPDRTLARMVAAQMQRFGVAIDDSAGRPLMDTPAGCFLRLAIALVASQAAPADLLALLRHPLAGAGLELAECRRLSRVLEKEMLRGIRRSPGLDALIAAAEQPALKRLLADLKKHMQPLADMFAHKKPISLQTLLKEHLAWAEWLALTARENGESRLWAGETGNQLAAFFAELLEHADLLSAIDPISYPNLFESLLAGHEWWPHYGLHPRLHILSPMEARMQHYDRVILGSLNEGMWPALASADPWMSRPMRQAFGLPPIERAIGQSAHDFYMLCAAGEVILSRARKVEGVPTVPSRWLIRLETFVKGKDAAAFERMQPQARFAQGIALLDAPLAVNPIEAPSPTPPLAARPRQMRVTAIDTWLRDPYMIYAKYILKLNALEPLDQDPDAADFGTIIHNTMEQFTQRFPAALPADAHAQLLECGRVAFAEWIDRPAVACLWWPRFEAMAGWIIETEIEKRKTSSRVLGEIKGEWKIDVGGKDFTLTTRIDRMEIRGDAVTIADYKTGIVPSKKEVQEGAANQLPLEALIVRHGALSTLSPWERGGVSLGEGGSGSGVASGSPHPLPEGEGITLEYWKLAGNQDQCEIQPVETDLAATHERLLALIRRFDQAGEPYRAQSEHPAPRYNDYAHLTRRQEWEDV